MHHVAGCVRVCLSTLCSFFSWPVLECEFMNRCLGPIALRWISQSVRPYILSECPAVQLSMYKSFCHQRNTAFLHMSWSLHFGRLDDRLFTISWFPFGNDAVENCQVCLLSLYPALFLSFSLSQVFPMAILATVCIKKPHKKRKVFVVVKDTCAYMPTTTYVDWITQ